jgi:hypothetical protein
MMRRCEESTVNTTHLKAVPTVTPDRDEAVPAVNKDEAVRGRREQSSSSLIKQHIRARMRTHSVT